MKISTELFEGNDKIGEIWTNGSKVFYAPTDSMFLKGIIDDDQVYDLSTEDTIVTARSNPTAFVRNLCYQYKGRVYATVPKVEK